MIVVSKGLFCNLVLASENVRFNEKKAEFQAKISINKLCSVVNLIFSKDKQYEWFF